MWWSITLILLLAISVQISNSGIPLNITAKPNNSTAIDIFRSHRIIKRFTAKIKIPRPQLPTLPRPTFPFPVFSRELPKGDNGKVPISKKQRRRPIKSGQLKEDASEERTLLAAKKALLLKKVILAKKAIILSKISKKKKKAALAYGLHKLSKVKGFTLKAPNMQISYGSPNKKGSAVVAADKDKVVAYAGDDPDNSTGEDSESNEDDDDDDDDIDKDEDDYDEDDPKPQVNPSTNSQNNDSISMMQQLQQQLQQKQQEELNQSQSSPELLQSQQQHQAIVVTTALPHSTTESTETEIETEIETYTSQKKAAKKAAKKAKKKGKATPRPVNLGVKAALFKKFDKLTKKAQNQLSSFVQIDIDFFRSGITAGRSAIEDLMESRRFVSRTSKVSQRSFESTDGHEYSGETKVPKKFVASWKTPVWKSQYPTETHASSDNKNICKEGVGLCKLTPVYILFKHDV